MTIQHIIGSINSKRSTFKADDNAVFSLIYTKNDKNENWATKVDSWDLLERWVTDLIDFEQPTLITIQIYTRGNEEPVYVKDFVPEYSKETKTESQQTLSGPLGLAEMRTSIMNEIEIRNLKEQVPQLKEDAKRANEEAESWKNKHDALSKVINYAQIAETLLGLGGKIINQNLLGRINGELPSNNDPEPKEEYEQISHEEQVKLQHLERIIRYLQEVSYNEFIVINNLIQKISSDKTGRSAKFALDALDRAQNTIS